MTPGVRSRLTRSAQPRLAVLLDGSLVGLARMGVLADQVPAAVERVLEEYRQAPGFPALARMGLLVAEHAQLRARSLGL